MKRDTLQYQIASVFIYSITVDLDVTEKEMTKLSETLMAIYKDLGIQVDDIELFLGDCFEDFNQLEDEEIEKIVNESINTLGNSMENEMLYGLYNALEVVLRADVVSNSEKLFIDTIKNKWNIQ